ncbi:hypothetical protein ACFY0F_00535 [Streptomyces sp. NPDC001544]|uniref:hypothetical protein n=1 Tax=Streptomyces sp. NPDC001544 TaxID=3364584 RepID=UPI0036B57118
MTQAKAMIIAAVIGAAGLVVAGLIALIGNSGSEETNSCKGGQGAVQNCGPSNRIDINTTPTESAAADSSAR